MSQIKCVVVTPEETAVDGDCRFVALPLFDGEMGVGINHAPMIGRLGYGELRIRDDVGNITRYYVDGGFVQIANNVVSIMTNRAVPASKLNAAELRDRLGELGTSVANTDDLLAARDKGVTQARAQLRLAEHV